MTKTEIFKAAHRVALTEYVENNYKSKYSYCLSEALKSIYYTLRQEKKINSLPEGLTAFIKNNVINNSLHVSNDNIFNKLKEFSYKNWPTNTGYSMLFSEKMLNAIK